MEDVCRLLLAVLVRQQITFYFADINWLAPFRFCIIKRKGVENIILYFVPNQLYIKFHAC